MGGESAEQGMGKAFCRCSTLSEEPFDEAKLG